MENKHIIRLTNVDGKNTEAYVLLFFKLDDKDYIIYTLNEKDKNMITVYASNLINNDGKYQFVNIEDENTWTSIKKIMKDIIINGKISN